MTRSEPPFWNAYWTVAVIGAVFTVIVAILEGLGVFHDVGVALGFVGLVVTSLFGASGATKTATRTMHRELEHTHDTLRHMLLVLNQIRDGIDQIRDGIDKLNAR